MALAWNTELPHTEKLVLLALCDNANDEGLCFPSVPTLVRKCGMSERGLQNQLERLESAKHIERHFRQGKSTYYTVNPRTACAPQDMRPASDAPTPARGAPPPPQDVHPTPAPGAPITIRDPSVEPSSNRQSARKRASTPTATRLPADFVLSPARRTVAVVERLDAERTFAKFCDYWRAKSGAGARKHDWDATWRNWCRTEADKGGKTVATARRKTADELEAEERGQHAA